MPQPQPQPQPIDDPNAISPWQQKGQKVVDGVVEGLRGALGGVLPGVSVPNTTAGHAGELLAAAAPLAAPLKSSFIEHAPSIVEERLHPAVEKLVNMLWDYQPEAVNPMKQVERTTGHYAGPPSPVRLPQGFESVAPTLPRDPAVEALYNSQQKALAAGSPAPDLPPRTTGRWMSGPKMTNRPTKLSIEDVKQIKQLQAKGEQAADILQKFGHVNPQTVRSVLTGGTWNSVKP